MHFSSAVNFVLHFILQLSPIYFTFPSVVCLALGTLPGPR